MSHSHTTLYSSAGRSSAGPGFEFWMLWLECCLWMRGSGLGSIRQRSSDRVCERSTESPFLRAPTGSYGLVRARTGSVRGSAGPNHRLCQIELPSFEDRDPFSRYTIACRQRADPIARQISPPLPSPQLWKQLRCSEDQADIHSNLPAWAVQPLLGDLHHWFDLPPNLFSEQN